jgi:molybdopterin/thiamine biosynthesis adenylyltransferase
MGAEEPGGRAADLAEHFRRRLAAGRQSLTLAETHALAQEFGCSVAEVELAALQARVVPERYRRNLGTVGIEGQMRLLRATVAIVGAGGLGGWIIEGLARMGVGHLIVVDGDVFQENNLNRQLGCTESTLGRPKAACLAERVAQVNRAVHVTAHSTWLTEENGPALLAGAEVIVDALDTLPARLLLQRVARALRVPLVHGAIGGYAGQVMTILPEDAGLEALYGPQASIERGVEAQLGNPAATPMMIAAWEIQEVVKYLVGQGAPLRGRMLLLDAEYGEVTEIRIEGSGA